MRCDGCGNDEATVSETLRVQGALVERHLCEACARKMGVIHQPAPTPKPAPATTESAAQPGGRGKAEAGPAAVCPSCGLTFAGFRQNGQLGCPACYTAFEAALSPLLQRAQEGGTHHVGKVPRRWATTRVERAQQAVTHAVQRAGSVVTVSTQSIEDTQRKATALKRQLAEAIVAEQYELAAQLRDELRRLGADGPPNAGGSRPPDGATA
ncbi:MAG: UvrB/UvrC motif-containing protein [Phycisphaerales bacterium]